MPVIYGYALLESHMACRMATDKPWVSLTELSTSSIIYTARQQFIRRCY